MPASVRSALLDSLAEARFLARLGDALFDPANWHQSLTPELSDNPDLRRRLSSACARLSETPAATITFDRIRGTRDWKGNVHWTVVPSRPPAPFEALDAALRAALEAEDIVACCRRHPHVTVSYRAPHEMQAIRIPSVAWTIDGVELVSPGGSPYRYRTLGRWSLREPAPVAQLALPV
ncbi:MAG TPA: 2'-5' RNA ligase family protein [Lysobacter sp.]|nr:2'-5' RNA ligase family protein [Lysobacter sp.]